MMKAGEIQAGFTGPAGVGRAGPPISGWDKASEAAGAADTYPELIANVEQVERDWFHRTGIYPIHGLVVVKTAVLAQHPHVAKSLFDAFRKAKDAYVARLKAGEGDSADDVKYRKMMALMPDPLPYGMAANRSSIEALVTYSLQQKLIPSRPQLDRVFVEIDS
jgi:4,5-dihydroxyphthalate decarboxylase